MDANPSRAVIGSFYLRFPRFAAHLIGDNLINDRSKQYGSDALAGVINIVLKDGYKGGFRSSYGSTYAGDGGTFVLGANKGFKFGEDGTLHGAFEYRELKPAVQALNQRLL